MKKPPYFEFTRKFPKGCKYEGKLIPDPNPKCAFYFYQTYGFPVEMWMEEFKRKVKDEKWFTAHYEDSIKRMNEN